MSLEYGTYGRSRVSEIAMIAQLPYDPNYWGTAYDVVILVATMWNTSSTSLEYGRGQPRLYLREIAEEYRHRKHHKFIKLVRSLWCSHAGGCDDNNVAMIAERCSGSVKFCRSVPHRSAQKKFLRLDITIYMYIFLFCVVADPFVKTTKIYTVQKIPTLRYAFRLLFHGFILWFA